MYVSEQNMSRADKLEKIRERERERHREVERWREREYNIGRKLP